MALAASSSSITDRMIRAARLDVNLYEEVEVDLNATTQALSVVVVAAVAAGIAGAIGALVGGHPGAAVGAVVGGLLSALIGWAVWSGVIFFVGTKMFGGTATYGEVLRTTGFAQSPGVFNILGFIPVLGPIISFAVAIWQIVTGFIAARQALDLDNGKTIGTIVIAIIAYLIVLAIVGTLMAVVFGTAALLR